MSDSPPDSLKLLLGGPEPGTRFGNYRLLSNLGRGGFATVFKAELMGEYGFTKQVALKVLRRRVDSLDEREVTGFLNEARLGAYLSHSNLVEFYECGRVDDLLYIAMELVPGPNLSQVLRMIPDHLDPLEPAAVLTIAAQTARGLKALHEATIDGRRLGAIHRDMKPANILLAPQGQAKITDYGITRVAADFYQTMASGTVRGSPLYMSPEQARGEDLTQATDVFSFGLVVLEMITGEPVFLANSLDAIVQRVREADVGPSLAAGRRMNPQLTTFLEGCLAPRAEARYSDGAALLEAIKEIGPPAFGDERVAEIASEGARILQEYEDKRRSVPVRKYWGRLPDAGGEDEGEVGDGAPEIGGEGTADGEGTPEEREGEGTSDDEREARKDRDRHRSSRRDPPPLKVTHDGPSRAIRGDAVSLTVSVSPPGTYPATVWYRCTPDGAWQRRKSEGGTDGTLHMTIPAGDWQVAGCDEVDYFVEVEGESGLKRVGSTIKPLAYRLY